MVHRLLSVAIATKITCVRLIARWRLRLQCDRARANVSPTLAFGRRVYTSPSPVAHLASVLLRLLLKPQEN